MAPRELPNDVRAEMEAEEELARMVAQLQQHHAAQAEAVAALQAAEEFLAAHQAFLDNAYGPGGVNDAVWLGVAGLPNNADEGLAAFEDAFGMIGWEGIFGNQGGDNEEDPEEDNEEAPAGNDVHFGGDIIMGNAVPAPNAVGGWLDFPPVLLPVLLPPVVVPHPGDNPPANPPGVAEPPAEEPGTSSNPITID